MSSRATAVAKSAAHYARTTGRSSPAAVAAEQQLAAAAPKDLDSPAVQWRIENPETMKVVLDLDEHGDREIEIKTVFSYADINDRKIFADLEAFSTLVGYELSSVGVGLGDPKWREKAMLYVNVIAKGQLFRDRANAIVAKISRYTDPWKTQDEKGLETLHARPTQDELFLGMNDDTVSKLAEHLISTVGRVRGEYAARKKARMAGA